MIPLQSYTREIHNLVNLLTEQEWLEYLSCVWHTPTIAIEVGAAPNPSTKTWMQQNGVSGLVGVTPTNPIQAPSASKSVNDHYVESFERKLKEFCIPYIPCWGKSNNFPSSDGCFLLNTSIEQAIALLLDDSLNPTQLAILYLPIDGVGKIVSCIG